MELGVLGPLVVRRDGRDEALGGPRQRALLAILLLRANETVSRDRLIDGLWGAQPPPTADHTLDTYVSRLRKLLGDDRLERRPPGYALRVEPGELDLDRFEDLLRSGREALARGEPAAAADALSAALALWRGPALADLQYEPFAQQAVEQLEERRLQAAEERVEADLALGRSAELVPELEALARDHPFRERLLGQLMLALYRAGRQAEALAAFEAGRRRLAEELGLEPGPSVRRLQEAILAQDPALVAHIERRAERRGPGARPKRRVVGALVALAATAGLAAVLIGTGGSGARDEQAAAGAARTVRLAGTAAAMAFAHGSLWVAGPDRGEVLRVDPASGDVADRIAIGEGAGALAIGGGSVWAARVRGEAIARIDPHTGTVAQTVQLGNGRVAALAFGTGALWVADPVDKALLEIDPATGQLRRRMPLDLTPTALAIDGHEVWVADYDGAQIAHVDARNGQTVATLPVGNGPAALTIAGRAVWVANTLDSTVAKVDTSTAALAAVIPVGSGPAAIAATGEGVSVASRYASSVTRIDVESGAIAGTDRVEGEPTALATAGDRVWVGVRPREEHRGGTLRLLHTRPLRLDPALQQDLLLLQADRLVRSNLVAYNHVSGPAGTQLVPDLAVAIPRPTDGGRAYTFRLRPGIRYSDGRPLHASDFRRAIERVFALSSEGSAPFLNIVGAPACATTPQDCHLSQGIATDDAAGTVTFRLRTADPEFLTFLAVPGASPVPAGTPFRDAGHRFIPGTGPYMVESASAREIRYVRNPHFREWSHAASPDGNADAIVMRTGVPNREQTREIEAGRADWAVETVPADRLPGLRARYPGRFHRGTIPTTSFLQFNPTRRPFDDVRVRRALNYAIDRREIVRLYGGTDLATPTCQVLPPGLLGYRRYCPYTRDPDASGRWKGPDLRRARRLVAASGTRGTRVTVWGWSNDPATSQAATRYVGSVLRRLGYRARVHLVPHDQLDAPLATIQVIAGAWGDTPYGMFATWFTCDGPNVHGWFCDRRIDRMLERAQQVKSSRPRAAAALWAAIDRRLVDQAAWLPTHNDHLLEFVSERLRNYQFHPYWGFIADQAWLAGH